MNPTTIRIGSREVGSTQPCFVLAEVASAHEGSVDQALKMLDAAFRMGADGIKFQLFKADRLVVNRHPGRKDFEQIELTDKEWRKVLSQAKGSGLSLLAECFDAPSLELAVEAGADAYKVHTTDMENKDFIRAVVDVKKPVFFATGGVNEEALADALSIVGDRELGLLFGFQTFPTPVGEIGNMVCTILHRRQQPMIRFNLRDLTRIVSTERCECGSCFRRMQKMLGRSDTMVRIRGVSIWPQACLPAIKSDNRTTGEWLCIAERNVRDGVVRDEMTVKVEVRDDAGGWDGLKDHIEKRLHSDLGLKLAVELVEEDALMEWSNRGREGKPKRILDHRFDKK